MHNKSFFIEWSTRGWKILLEQLLCSQCYHFQRMQIGPCFQGRKFPPPVLIFGERRCRNVPACCRVGQTISWTYPKHSTQLLKAKKLEPKVFVQFFLEGHGRVDQWTPFTLTPLLLRGFRDKLAFDR